MPHGRADPSPITSVFTPRVHGPAPAHPGGLHTARLPLGSLRVFVAVAEHLNFTRAADALGVTASAASLQIRALEEYLSRPCSGAMVAR